MPGATAVTLPAASTVATLASADSHVTPSTSAVNWTSPPISRVFLLSAAVTLIDGCAEVDC